VVHFFAVCLLSWYMIVCTYEPPEAILPCTAVLEELVAQLGDDIALYFENMETGFSFGHNADRRYFGASVSKAFFALYLFLRVEREGIDLEETLVYTREDFLGGAGLIVRRYPVGTVFSKGELIRLMLSYSDNIATLILRRHFGLEGYRRFVADLGINPAYVGGNVFNSRITAAETGIFAREIYAYIASGGRYAAKLKAALLDNQYPFTVSDYPKASKTGWTRPRAWHCMAVIFAPSPYVLVILGERGGWTNRDFREYAEISMAFQHFNDTWFHSKSEVTHGSVCARRSCVPVIPWLMHPF